MKKKYEPVYVDILELQYSDVLSVSGEGELEGDETLYPVPGGWLS